MRHLFICAGLVILANCAATTPNDGYSAQMDERLREAQLTGVPVPDAVTQDPLYYDANAIDNSVVNPPSEQDLASVRPNPEPTKNVFNNPGLSDEQDFQAVADRQTIESDAERLARNRALYQVIEPTAVPRRPGTQTPNIVEYALRTNNPLGAQLYERSGFAAQTRFDRNCAKFTSDAAAQESFLANGGPERDPKGIDPDGDGFACYWDPRPFRRAVQSSVRSN